MVTIENVCRVLWDRQGKRLRSRLVYWFGEMAGVAPANLETYAWTVEAVHTATLLHDDVIDRADERRGGPSANRLFDNTLPVLSGDWLLAEALQKMATQGDKRLFVSLCQAIKDLVQGEALQYQSRYRLPDRASELLEIHRLKTVSLFAWAASVGPTLSGRPLIDDVRGFIHAFGLLFQFSDDYLDITGTDGKGRWTDLRQGLVNLAAWHVIKSDPALEREVREAFNARRVDDALLEKFAAKPLDGVRARLQVRRRDAERRLARLPRCEMLSELVRLCVERCE